MELRYRREAAVGLLLVVGATVFVLLMLWLRGVSVRKGETVHARFDDVLGLKVGDRVRSSGVTVGHVRRIELVGPGEVDVWFDVGHGPRPREDAQATIRSLDFFGARYVEYQPGRSSRQLDPSGLLRGTRERDLQDMASGVVDPARALLNNASEMVTPETARELRGVLVQARRTLEMIGAASQAPSRELTGALTELRHVFQRLDQVVASSQQNTSDAAANLRDLTGNLAAATRQLGHTTAALDSILTKINSGQGALGQLINDTLLVGELRRTNSALADLLTDLKANPGRYIRLRL